ncbi:MAG: hypothetical protein AB8I08_21480 [Sandaracinaceae bacterium]
METRLWLKRLGFVAAVLGASALATVLMIFASGFLGLFLYTFLIVRMHPDNLAGFSLFFLPFVGLGIPGLIVAVAFLLKRKRPLLILGLTAHAVVWGTLGFAGFWVGAMGI